MIIRSACLLLALTACGPAPVNPSEAWTCSAPTVTFDTGVCAIGWSNCGVSAAERSPAKSRRIDCSAIDCSCSQDATKLKTNVSTSGACASEASLRATATTVCGFVITEAP